MSEVEGADPAEFLPGFEAEGVVALTGLYPYLEPSVGEALRAELASIPQIQAMTDTYFTPKQSVAPSDLRTEIAWTGQPADQETAFQVVTADTAFASTFRPRLLAGEWLRDGSGREVVLNEEAARVMGLDEPVGADVQKLLEKEPEPRLLDRCLSQKERELYRKSGNKRELFSLLWSLKESYAKMDGAGLGPLHPGRISIELGEEGQAGVSGSGAKLSYRLEGGYVFAVCSGTYSNLEAFLQLKLRPL